MFLASFIQRLKHICWEKAELLKAAQATCAFNVFLLQSEHMAAGSGPWFEETLKKSEHPVQHWKLWRKSVSANDYFESFLTTWIGTREVTVFVKSHVASNCARYLCLVWYRGKW